MQLDSTLRALQDLTEDELISAVIAPLFKALGYTRVSFTGATAEAGTDLVCWRSDVLGDTQLDVVQVKRFKPSGRATATRSFSELVTQLEKASKASVPNIDGHSYSPSSVIFITPYAIDHRALAARLEGHSALRREGINIIDGPKLVELLSRHRPDLAQRFSPDEPEAVDADPDDNSPIAGPLRVYIDANVYTAEEKGELLSLISELYSMQRGDRLVIDNLGTAEPVLAGVGAPDGGQS